MAAPTITAGGITFTFNQGNVDSVESTINSKSENTELTATGPMGSRNMDYDGATKTIIVAGKLTAAATSRTSSGTVTTILAQKQWLESVISGQQGEIVFTSTYETQSVLQKSGASSPYQAAFTSTKIHAAQIKFKEVAGIPSKLDFTMTLTVGEPYS